MSHSAYYSFHINVERELLEIENIENDLTYLCNITQSELLKSSVQNLFSDISELKQQIVDIGNINGSYNANAEAYFHIQKSKLLKRIQNMQIGVSFADLMEEQNDKLNNLIVENGFLSQIAIERLQKENTTVTPENFANMIQIIKQKQIDDQKHNSLKNEMKQYVLSQDIDSDLKGSLLNEFAFISNYQELADFLPYVKETINKYKEAMHKYKIYSDILAKHKYKSKKIEFVIQTDPENKLKPRYAFITKFNNPFVKNNSFMLTINLDGTISYDIGDYEKHMCWSLAEQVEEDLKKSGYFIKDKQISRSISGARPLQNAKKLKEENN
ncbi:hypothetical protein [Mycoplasma zalophi]|uniref:hypothetical protein n=1 Tax=Mycoplasma zalophi TaxID=191287 RepID=UPI001C114407|nr:hypothetical protein [Mycoplasma zalophi]MBU4691108.1 hypothetical protein [Mycoplasma zalophi]